MSFGVFDFLVLAGALGFFIYGMKIMSDGIQKIAGNKLRSILNAMTTNRFTGLLTGFTTTSLIQSSSATTVLVVSFVNAGLLSLKQAIGVIMGANIGTTVTAVLISALGFKLSLATYSLPIIAIGLPLMFAKSSKLRSWSEFLIGFALLFMGIEALKNSVPSPEVMSGALNFLEGLNNMGILSTIIFVLIGTLLTVVLQSSSAAMALTLVLCEKGIIGFDMAAAIVLGENIGTTITANIAALVGNVHAKRAARAHLIFNVFGVLWMLPLFGLFLSSIDSYMVNSGFTSPYVDDSSIKWGLTAFHISFNILNSVFLIWFVDFIAKVVTKLVPSKGDDTTFSLDYIGSGVMKTPELALVEATKACGKIGETTSKLNEMVLTLLQENRKNKQQKIYDQIKGIEESTDLAEEEMANYLSKLSEDEISQETSVKVRGLLSIVDDLESITDIYYHLALVHARKAEQKIYFLPNQREGVKAMLASLEDAFKIMLENLNKESRLNEDDIAGAKAIEDEIDTQRDELRKMHLKGLESGEFNIQSAMVFGEFYTSFERIGDYIYKVSRALRGDV
jgi:phosphate:Na+ symporter